jgi:hypothetical protein
MRYWMIRTPARSAHVMPHLMPAPGGLMSGLDTSLPILTIGIQSHGAARLWLPKTRVLLSSLPSQSSLAQMQDKRDKRDHNSPG